MYNTMGKAREALVCGQLLVSPSRLLFLSPFYMLTSSLSGILNSCRAITSAYKNGGRNSCQLECKPS